MAKTEGEIYELPENWANIPEIVSREKIRERLEAIVSDCRAQYKRAQYVAKMEAEKQELSLNQEQFKFFTLQAFFRMNGKAFEIDNENARSFETLLAYFMSDPKFESMGENFSLKKGLLLFGGVGCGKTSMMKMFQQNPKNSFVTISCRLIAAEYAEQGDKGIEKYYNPHYAPIVLNNYFNTERMGICFDDLGTENESKHFGNHKNVIQEILLNRYDNEHDFTGKTHITTNLSGDQIEQAYGARARSRMRAMFNTIEFKGKKDRRI